MLCGVVVDLVVSLWWVSVYGVFVVGLGVVIVGGGVFIGWLYDIFIGMFVVVVIVFELMVLVMMFVI